MMLMRNAIPKKQKENNVESNQYLDECLEAEQVVNPDSLLLPLALTTNFSMTSKRDVVAATDGEVIRVGVSGPGQLRHVLRPVPSCIQS